MPDLSTEPRYLSKAQVADRYGVTYRTVSRWIFACQLPAVRVGNQVRINEADLHAFEVPLGGAR